MLIPFKVGDTVVVRPNVSDYSITTPGSQGEVISVTTEYFQVAFTKLTSRPYSTYPERFSFSWDELENFSLVFSNLSEADKKYSKVVLKIRQMNADRKEKGYAF